jgi:hypothetical protein
MKSCARLDGDASVGAAGALSTYADGLYPAADFSGR